MDDVSRLEQTPYEEDEINLLDLFLVLLRRKWLIFWIVLLAIASSVTISLLLPLKYTATSRILPPQETSPGLSGLLSQSGGAFSGLAGSLLGGTSSADLYVGILESRSVADSLIREFNLKEVYEQDYLEDTYKKLSDNTNIDVSRKTQVISVSVEDRDPKRAADMANAYLEALDHINRTVNVSEGHRKRVFLEKRLKKVKDDLMKAESALETFQQKYGLVSISDQAKAAIEGAAKIKGDIIAAQTELEVLKKFGTEKQNEAVMLKAKIAGLKEQLARIEKGNPPTNKNDSDEFFIPFNQIPELGMKLARLMREAKIQEEVFKLITTQYEMAKIEEAKDMDTIQVLDRAVPPDKKSSPKRALIVILSTIVAFFLAVFLAFFLEYMDRVKTEDPERYQQVSQAMRLRKR
ncbi:MAG: lipopolysaccharide biosynthesis protein [Deltaproteobacteria bacterium]|nr:MAG: lipopolysaccharide biosynthesis protein [Deltaproteobacteria bacterium]